MRRSLNIWKATVSSAVSLWMAVVACLLGCALPVSANSSFAAVAPVQQESESMMGMENCPHHSAPSNPESSKNKQSAPDRMSCCPLEITIASKARVEPLNIVVTQYFILPSQSNLTTDGFASTTDLAPSISKTGRETLLKTQLLRI